MESTIVLRENTLTSERLDWTIDRVDTKRRAQSHYDGREERVRLVDKSGARPSDTAPSNGLFYRSIFARQF